MNDIGGSWDRRGEFLVSYNADTKDLNIPCEISLEASPTSNKSRAMNSTEIEKIAELFNSVNTGQAASPKRKMENTNILKAQESIKMGVQTTFVHNGTTYKITPLQQNDKEKIAKLQEVAKPRNESIRLVTANPDTSSARRISATVTLSRSTTSPVAKAPIPHAKPAERLAQTSWMRFDRYLGFRQERKIEPNFFEVKLKDEVVTNSTTIDAIEKALSTNPELSSLSDAMRKGKDVELTIENKTYQLAHVNHSITPEAENKKIFDLVASREKWLFKQIISGPRPAEIQKALLAQQTKSDTVLRASPPQQKPLAPVLRQSITQDSSLGKSVSAVSNQIISPTGTVARRKAPPVPTDSISRSSPKPLPTPPASRRGSLTGTPSPTAAPRLDLWTEKKTDILMDRFILIDEQKRPIRDKTQVARILKEHYDNLSRADRSQFDAKLGENEVVKFGVYALVPK